MSETEPARRRVAYRFLAAVLCLAVSTSCPTELMAGKKGGGGGGSTSTPTLVRIEEDWELVVSSVVPNRSCPQICCVISPTGNLDGVYATVELNHHSLLTNESGGLQLQVWEGQARLGPVKAVSVGSLSSADTITWTTSMRVKDGALTFELLNGDSTSWGKFGTDTTTSTSSGGDTLIFGNIDSTTTSGSTVYATDEDSTKTLLLTTEDAFYSAVTTTKADLATYNAQVSIDESAVTYGGNHVLSLTLKTIRGYMSDGSVVTENVARLIHSNAQ